METYQTTCAAEAAFVQFLRTCLYGSAVLCVAILLRESPFVSKPAVTYGTGADARCAPKHRARGG